MIQRERLINHLLDIIRIDSPSKRERDVAMRLKADLEGMGAKVSFDDAGEKINGTVGNLIAHFKGEVSHPPPFLLSAHMDTVNPGEGIQPRIEGNTIRSDGTTVLGGDDKSGIAIIVEVIRSLQEEQIPYSNLEVVFTVCEESGLQGAKNLDISALRSRFGLVFDSDAAGTLFTRAPSCNRLEFRILGLEAHAGMYPERGLNAIQIASKGIAKMSLGRIDPETTANIGIIEGGVGINVVPNQVVLRGEARSHSEKKLSDQTEHMKQCLQEAVSRHSVRIGGKEYRARLEEKITRDYDGMNIKENSSIVRLVMDAARDLGDKVENSAMGGGCDANVFNKRGFEVANLGTGMHDIHTVNEWLDIDEMVHTARLVEQILKRHAQNRVSPESWGEVRKDNGC